MYECAIDNCHIGQLSKQEGALLRQCSKIITERISFIRIITWIYNSSSMETGSHKELSRCNEVTRASR